jgi:hypothetical protein
VRQSLSILLFLCCRLGVCWPTLASAQAEIRPPVLGFSLMPQARCFLEQELRSLRLEMVASPAAQTTAHTEISFEPGIAMADRLYADTGGSGHIFHLLPHL